MSAPALAATATTMSPEATRSTSILRTSPTCLVAIGALLLVAAACTSGGRSEAQIAADGAAEVARHGDDPLTAAVDVDGVTLLGNQRVFPASKNNDPGRVFGTLGFALTEFRWSYKVTDEIDLAAALDLAAAELERRGATLSRSTGLLRELHAESAGDVLTITFQVLEPTFREIAHRITVTASGE